MPLRPATHASRRALPAAALLAALSASPAGAAPVPCPVVAGDSFCNVAVANASARVRVTSGGSLQVDSWEVEGVPQLYREGFVVYDFVGGDFPDIVLQSATVDTATATVTTLLRDVSSAIAITVVFTLSQDGDASVLDEDFEVKALVNGISGRVYAVHDFDLAGDSTDDAITATAGGSVITQSDGGTQVTSSVSAGPGPDAFEVATCCSLDSILADVFVTLDGTASLLGPDDFQSAQSYDRSLSKNQVFAVSVRHEIVVPELGPGAAAAAAGLALAGLSARRRGRGPGAQPAPAR